MANNRNLRGDKRPINEGVLDAPNSIVFSPDGSKVESVVLDESFTVTNGVLSAGGGSTSGEIVVITCDAIAIDATDGVAETADNLVLNAPTNGYGDGEPTWCSLVDGFTDRVELEAGTYLVNIATGVTATGYTFTGETSNVYPTGSGGGSTSFFRSVSATVTEVYGLDPETWSTEQIISIPAESTTRNKLRISASLQAPLNSPYPDGSTLTLEITIVRL